MANEVTVVEPQRATPGDLLTIAVNQNADLDKLEKLMELQERWERREAEKAFVVAKANFQAETIPIVRDKENAQYKSKYVSKGNLINTASPFLSKHGFSYRFDISQEPDAITLSCILTHKDGHSEKCTMFAPPDKSGQKNPIQQIKSTKTYLEIATFEAVTGLASRDGAMDDDGNAAGGVETISEKQENDLLALGSEVGADLDKFCKFFKIADISDLPASKYAQAIQMLEKKRA